MITLSKHYINKLPKNKGKLFNNLEYEKIHIIKTAFNKTNNNNIFVFILSEQ